MQRPDTICIRTALYEEAVSILEQEYASDLTVAELAGRVACSCRQLQRAFQEVGDTSFRTALTEIRMDRAAEMLARDPVSVRDTARHVGYRQPAQFAKAFRRHHGLSPSQYRVGSRLGRLRELREAVEARTQAAA
ncbi:MAG: helix-turn-helix transcriptional regulator [Solirubrobacteraceae bacterium]